MQPTVEWIARTLERLGEASLASQLRKDNQAGRVTFGVIRDYLVFPNPDSTAEVGAGQLGLGASSTNTMTIAQRYETLYQTLNRARPYSQSSLLVTLASTVVHEYEHMRQRQPQHTAPFEDPAYRAQEAALGRWLGRLARELDNASTLPAGPTRTAVVSEASDLIRLIRSDVAALKEAVTRLEALGRVTPKRAWQWDNLVKLADRQLQRAFALEPKLNPAPAARSAAAVPKGGAWLLSSSQAWSDNPNIEDVIRQYAGGPAQVSGSVLPGVSRHSWVNPNREGSPRTSLSVTWSTPTSPVPPGGEIIVTARARDTGSGSGAGEGDFVSFSVGLYGSQDGQAWTFLAGNYPQLYASPRKQEDRTYRIPAPGAKWKHLAVSISSGNVFWSKYVNYTYTWKDE